MSGKNEDNNKGTKREVMVRQIVGAIGSIFAALCCIGTPAVLALLASIGAGFLIRDVILLPLLVVFLVIAVWGMMRTQDAHGQRGPLLVTVGSSFVIVAAVWFSRPVVILGLVGLIAASVWNMYLHKAYPQTAR
jgi:mercuric ion transport protein